MEKYSRTGTFSLRQLSTTERIAATFGPACGLPMCNQFFRPRATGRMEFSARLVLSSNSGYSKKRVSFFQSVSAYWQALLRALEGNARRLRYCGKIWQVSQSLQDYGNLSSWEAEV